MKALIIGVIILAVVAVGGYFVFHKSSVKAHLVSNSSMTQQQTNTSSSTPTSSTTTSTNNGIPQNGGGDHDIDNSGGPSDNDGQI